MTITVKGTSFSTDAVADDIFYRTDLGSWYQYNGSGWAGFGFLNLGTKESVTIASGAVTITRSNIIITGEGGAADDLDTINGTSAGDLIFISRNTNGGNTITLKDGTGNLQLAGDFAMDSVYDQIVLLNQTGTSIRELCRSNNA